MKSVAISAPSQEPREDDGEDWLKLLPREARFVYGEIDKTQARERFVKILAETVDKREKEYGFELDADDIKQIEGVLRIKYCGPQGTSTRIGMSYSQSCRRRCCCCCRSSTLSHPCPLL